LLTLIHTNDFHNRLTLDKANRLRQLRENIAEKGLMLDAGDAIGSGNLTFRPGGEPILDMMSDIGYDALTVGNREFHFSRMGLHCKLRRASFPVLCSNIRLSGKKMEEDPIWEQKIESLSETHPPDPPVQPYIVKELPSGWRIVVFGITVPMITERMLERKLSAYVFDDPLETAARLVPWLHSQYAPDLLIALTHIGIQQDRLLAERVPGIDLVIGGHTHVVLDQGERVGDSLIVQAGSHARYVGKVVVERKKPRPLLTASLEAL
jgi:2',3'-cyclic-nucleotide 2'-phosphodiesterase (5'-nucleotidase family)